MKTRVLRQRPPKRFQRSGQRADYRGNPYTGMTWGTAGWPDDTAVTDDLTTEAFGEYPAPFVSLASLKADGTYGDGNLAYGSGADFAEGKYVRLEDESLAFYRNSVWALGAAVEANDITVDVFGVQPSALADLATLKADGTYGDGNLAYGSGADFTEGQYVTLADASQAYYDESIWIVGACPADTDITAEVFGEYPGPFADLATLIADGTYGDGNLTYNAGGDFTTGQFVVLEDASLAHYVSAGWVVGAKPA